jgi:hypothetical protein
MSIGTTTWWRMDEALAVPVTREAYRRLKVLPMTNWGDAYFDTTCGEYGVDMYRLPANQAT